MLLLSFQTSSYFIIPVSLRCSHYLDIVVYSFHPMYLIKRSLHNISGSSTPDTVRRWLLKVQRTNVQGSSTRDTCCSTLYHEIEVSMKKHYFRSLNSWQLRKGINCILNPYFRLFTERICRYVCMLSKIIKIT